MTRPSVLVLLAFLGLPPVHAAETDAAAGIDAEAETSGAAALDPDVAAGETLYQGVCRNCHGPKAQGIASYPRLSDKEVDYLVGRLERYREGEKIGPNSMLMIPHARELSDQDIVDIAHYVTTAFE